MDSRTGFSIALLLLGGVGMALVFTGKFKNVLTALQQPGDTGWKNDAGQAGSGAGATIGNPNPAGGTRTSTAGGGFGSDATGQQILNDAPPSKVSVNVGGTSFDLPFGSINTNPYSIPIAGTDGLAVAPFGATA